MQTTRLSTDHQSSDHLSAIITGGGSGMGAATARKLIDNGWNVTLFGRNLAKLEAMRDSLAQPERVVVVQGDVSQATDVERLVASHIESFGRLDGLVNSAGVPFGGAIETVSLEDWRASMAINVEGVFNTIQKSLPHLKEAGGAIVNVSSVSGLAGDWGFSPYNAAKGAVTNFTRSLALELGSQGVRINAVAPTLTESDMTSFVTEDDKVMAMFRNRIPLGRAAKAHEVAAAIYFLLSSEASFINGVNLPVDGGVTASNGQPNFAMSLETL